MTISNHDLVKNFLTGRHNNATEKSSNRMKIKEREDHTIIEGYGHALYALKTGGTVIIFDDWYGYSRTTSSHLNRIRRNAKADNHVTLVEDETIEQPKSHKSNKILEKMKCDYCNREVTTKMNKQNGLRVCDNNKCNQRMAKGENPKQTI